MKSSAILISSLVAALAACSDISGPETASSVSFTYQGPLSGTFKAEGDWRSDLLVHHTFAEGRRHTAPSAAVEAFGMLERPAGLVDQVQVIVPNRSTRSFAINMSTCSHLYGECPMVLIGMQGPNTGGEQYRYFCLLETGTIRVTSLSAARMKGDFSGTGICHDRDNETDETPYTITNGRFDVKLFDDDPWDR